MLKRYLAYGFHGAAVFEEAEQAAEGVRVAEALGRIRLNSLLQWIVLAISLGHLKYMSSRSVKSALQFFAQTL